MMRSATAAAVCAGFAALVVVHAAGAQQNIPGIPKAPSSGTMAPSTPRPPSTIPRDLPPQPASPSGATGHTPRGDVFGSPSTPVDNCSLGVSAAELDALRETILGLLARLPAERDSFLKADADVPADCTRQKAVFYMRALVVARNRG